MCRKMAFHLHVARCGLVGLVLTAAVHGQVQFNISAGSSTKASGSINGTIVNNYSVTHATHAEDYRGNWIDYAWSKGKVGNTKQIPGHPLAAISESYAKTRSANLPPLIGLSNGHGIASANFSTLFAGTINIDLVVGCTSPFANPPFGPNPNTRSQCTVDYGNGPLTLEITRVLAWKPISIQGFSEFQRR